MTYYEQSVQMIKERFKGKKWHDTIDRSVEHCYRLIAFAHEHIEQNPGHLVNFYRGLLTQTGTFDSTATSFWGCVASAAILKMSEIDKKIDKISAMRHTAALITASAEIEAKTHDELSAGRQHSLILRNIFNERAKPGDN